MDGGYLVVLWRHFGGRSFNVCDGIGEWGKGKGEGRMEVKMKGEEEGGGASKATPCFHLRIREMVHECR